MPVIDFIRSPEAGLVWVPLGGLLLAIAAASVESRIWKWRAGEQLQPARSRWVFRDPASMSVTLVALSDLRASLAGQHRPMPRIQLVSVHQGQVFVRLARPDPAGPVPPWQSSSEGKQADLWKAEVRHLSGRITGAPPVPALIHAGYAMGAGVLVNLAQADGLISVTGPAGHAHSVAYSMVLDLLTSPCARAVRVFLVGFDHDDLPGPLPRLHRFDSVRAALGQVQRDRNALGAHPVMLVLGQPPAGPDVGPVLDIARRADAGIMIMCLGSSPHARWVFHADSSGGIALPDPLALRLVSPAGEAVQLGQRLRATYPRSMVTAPADASQSHAEVRPGPAAPDSVEQTSPLLPRVPAQPGPAAQSAGDQLPRPLPARSIGPSTPGSWRTAVHQLDHPLLTEQDRAQVWDGYSWVGLLGEPVFLAPGISASAPDDVRHKVLAALALSGRDGLSRAAIDSVTGRAGVIDELARELTVSAQDHETGDRPVLRQHGNRWMLSPETVVDVWLFEELVRFADPAGEPDTTREWARLVTALSLIRGELFTGASLRKELEQELSGSVTILRSRTVGAVHRTTDLAAKAGNREWVEWALRQGLTLFPALEAMWRSLLLYQRERNPAALEDTVDEMMAALSRRSGDVHLQPETSALVARIREK